MSRGIFNQTMLLRALSSLTLTISRDWVGSLWILAPQFRGQEEAAAQARQRPLVREQALEMLSLLV